MNHEPTPTERYDWRTLVRSLEAYAIFTIDREGVIDSWNRGVEALLGYDEASFVGMPSAELFTPDERAAGVPETELRAAASTGEGQDDRWHVRRDGTHVWVNGLVTPVYDGRHQVIGYLKVMRDQTDAQLAAERLARRAREQRALAEIGARTLERIDVDGLLTHATHAVSEALEIPHVHAFDILDPGSTGAPRAGVGPLRERRRLDDAPRTPVGALDRVNGGIPDEVRLPLTDVLREAGVRTGVRVPIRGRHGAYGYLDALAEQEDAFRAEDLRFLQSVANLLSGALEQSRLQQELAHRAEHDALTGLPHRDPFEARLRAALEDARQSGSKVAALFIDLDRFKEINDELGHGVGDAVLRIVAARVTETLRARDTTARIGGDEFAVFLPEVKDRNEVAHVCERLLTSFRHPLEVQDRQLLVTTTVGAALFPDDASDARGLLQAADMAMYAGKHVGRNTFRFYARAQGATKENRVGLEEDLRWALENGHMEVRFEPRLDLGTGRVEAVEAVPWWNHPEHGESAAETLFSVASDAGVLTSLVDWTLHAACRHQRAWAVRLGRTPRLTVRLHAATFLQPTFPASCEALVMDSDGDLRPGEIELLVDEATIQEGAELTARHAAALRSAGFGLGLDDVGVGPVSLTRLVTLPWSELRLATRLTQGVEDEGHGDPLLAAVADHAMRHGVALAARDVRTAGQRDALRRLGVTLVQGPLVGPPVGANETLARLAADEDGDDRREA